LRNNLLAVVFAIATAFSAQAQYTDIQINPIGALFGSLSATAEFPVTESIGVEPALALVFRNRDVLGTDYKGRGFGAGVNGKFYFNPEDGHDKFYAMAYTRFSSVNQTVDSDGTGGQDWSNTRLSLGVGLGYKWVADNGLVFELAVGGGRALVNNYDFDTEDSTFEDALEGLSAIDIYGRLSIGYRLGN